ncbi:MAG: hypothetical protein WBN85_11985 [Candidatus Macondimonas sp.]
MQHPTLNLQVTRQDESVPRGFGRTYIPTLGHPASTFDAYRTERIDSVFNKPESWCLTDTDAAAALGRIIDGPISSHTDIERAESALRAVLLHEYVEILVPCAKGEQANGYVSYIRLDQKQRNEAAFSAFQIAPCRDLLIATEYVSISNGEVTGSSNQASQLLGKPLELLSEHYRAILQNASELASAYPLEIGASTYYTGAELASPMKSGAAGFIDELYRRIYRPWVEIAQATPPLHIGAKLPPLIAIVLSRAASRERIPEVLRELREELSKVRADLNRMNALLDSTMSQADIQAHVRRVNESFDAIVPEALLTRTERRWRRLASVFRLIRPVHQLYSIAVDPLAVDHEKLKELFKDMHSAVAANSRIVSRSVSASAFSELLRVNSVRKTVLTHFTDAEVRLLSERGRK